MAACYSKFVKIELLNFYGMSSDLKFSEKGLKNKKEERLYA